MRQYSLKGNRLGCMNKEFIEKSAEKTKLLLSEVNKVIVDKKETIKLCVTCLFAGGHFLLEDRPGMGKTSLVKTISKLLLSSPFGIY